MVVLRLIVNWFALLLLIMFMPIIAPILFIKALWEDQIWKCEPMDGSCWFWEKEQW